MKNSDPKSYDLELRNAFAGSQSIYKANLRKFYNQHSQAMTDQAFRRFLYGLEKRKIIIPIGAGIYALQDTSSQQNGKKKNFSPTLSQDLVALNMVIRDAFPYVQYLGWETRVLHELMIHQPSQNYFIVETEKDVCESLFNFLNSKYSSRTFLDPDQVIMERYVVHQPDSIIISRLITQAPKKKVHGVPFPKLEKILVDIFTDEEKFFFFQGEELVRIFENAFTSYWLNEKTLFRYAGRRKVGMKLRQFISKQTQIELSQVQGNIE